MLAAWTIGSITGANVRRHHMNDDFAKRKKERGQRAGHAAWTRRGA